MQDFFHQQYVNDWVGSSSRWLFLRIVGIIFLVVAIRKAAESALPQTYEGKQTKHWSRHVYIPYSSLYILVLKDPLLTYPLVFVIRSIDPSEISIPKLVPSFRISICAKRKNITNTLPETNIAPENGWLEDNPFLLGPGLFSGAVAVSFRKSIF